MSYCHHVVEPSGYLGFTHWTASPAWYGAVQKLHHTTSGDKESNK